MSQAKRESDRLEGITRRCIHIAIEVGAVTQDAVTDEITSNLDEDANKRAYANARAMCKEGEFDGTWEEVATAMKVVLS
jgi:hypothetical protein